MHLKTKECEMSFDSHTAASHGIVDFFVNCKRDGAVSRKNAAGWTPLMYACAFGHVSTVRALLRCGADAGACNDAGCTAAMLAACGGHADVLHTLLQSSTGLLDVVDGKGWTAVFHAAHMGQLECVKFLVQYKCSSINAVASPSGETVLMVAVRGGYVDLVNFLLCRGADATVATKSCVTALGIAETQGFAKIADVLWLNIAGSCWGRLNLAKFLNFLNLGKYHTVFLAKNIDFYEFLMMTDEDLKKTGVVLLGPRKKMVLAISKWHYFNQVCMSNFVGCQKSLMC